MSPWNYPFQLTFVPLIGALAAGNTVVVKPSRYAPATADVITEIVQHCFSPEYVSVIKGGRDVNTELLRQKFDYIFFTGSVTVGTLVMEAAAKHLTPVSLELGGKSPCIVDNTAKIDLAAKRIIWGKLLNAGQTCVAPDYILAHESIAPQLLDATQKYITEFFGVHPEKNPDYPKIISQKHFERLSNLIDSSHIYCGGQLNDQTLQIAPAIVYPASSEDTVMDDEIFGPILPVLEYRKMEEAIAFINSRPKPLALYHFTESKKNQMRITRSISFGGGCINDTVVHIASSHMPFGGVGASGMGSYHGKASFETFSHRKAILKKSTRTDVPLRYAPYNKGLRLLKRLMG
jgi:aldehyde dehydrogenase (NAD+)